MKRFEENDYDSGLWDDVDEDEYGDDEFFVKKRTKHGDDDDEEWRWERYD